MTASRSINARLRRRIDAVRRTGTPDEGMALVMVLIVTSMLTTMAVIGLQFSLTQLKQVRNDQNWQASLSAAQAGVDDYVSKLNADGSYWRFGATSTYAGASTFSGTSGNAAFTGWVSVPGVSNRAQYRYDVNNSEFSTRGVIKLRSTGKVGSETRTVEAQLRRGSFIDFLYFTDYETQDPAAYNPTKPTCEKYWYNARSTSNCTDIQFVTGDKINGPLHSNDAILMCVGAITGTNPTRYGPEFNGPVTTGYKNATAGGENFRRTCDTNTSHKPTFQVASDPAAPFIVQMPPTNASLRAEVDPTTPGNTTPGCLYTGPTKITFKSNGKMDIVSPATKQPHPLSYCRTGTDVLVPANGVIYVRNVPSTNDAYSVTPPASPACVSYPNGQAGNRLGFPIAGDITNYNCNAGDIFVEGSVNTRVTLAAENNIVVTWDLTYTSGVTTDNQLGLVANNYVEVYHPYSDGNLCATYQGSTCKTKYAEGNINVPGKGRPFSDANINAAILSVQHSFRVQNYGGGVKLNYLNVTGAIAQKFRGAVGTSGGSGTGYLKNYVYDERLRYDSPPKFLSPVASSFIPKGWSELNPAY